MRKAAVAILVCAAPLALAPHAAASQRIERSALRSALRAVPHASSRHPILPLPEPGARVAHASAAGELARLARSRAPGRVLVGLRAHEDEPAVAAALRRLGARVRTLDSIGVLASRVASPASVVAALRDDPRVAYIEPDRALELAADPADASDPDHFNLPYDWAFNAVAAGPAIAAAGGGSSRAVGVIDTGADIGHPDLVGATTRPYDALTGGSDVHDYNGHGTFVTGLISETANNNMGGKGVAGHTQVIPVRASTDGSFRIADVVVGIDAAIARGADILNLSLAGSSLTASQARAIDLAFYAGVLPVAAAGNRAEDGNPVEFPAAAIGGYRGAAGIGLSVGAAKPNGKPASFSDHNSYVSVAAPGASGSSCEFGVFSTIPRNVAELWDDPHSCSRLFADGGGRFAYGQGTSFSAPIAAGIAALAWQVAPKLESDQVGDVLAGSATQTIPGRRWNEYVGTGLVNGLHAVQYARIYDTRAPKAHGKARRKGKSRVAVRVTKSKDRTDKGHVKAGGVRYALLVSKNKGRTFRFAVNPKKKPFRKRVKLRGKKRYLLMLTVCDRAGNCSSKRLGRFKRRR